MLGGGDLRELILVSVVSGNEDWPIIVDTDAAFSSNVDCSDAEERKNLEFLSQKILDPMYRYK